jgi:predicted NBD/HSP70 family sugar kinase
MTNDGPLGYGKKGSLEGWCSGGEVCIRAENGDAKALKMTEQSAVMLGRFLAILIDIINPDRIVIGSIFTRSEGLFRGCLCRGKRPWRYRGKSMSNTLSHRERFIKAASFPKAALMNESSDTLILIPGSREVCLFPTPCTTGSKGKSATTVTA